MNSINDKGREAINELMEHAEIIAQSSMRHLGSVSPTLFIHGVVGKAMFAPREMADDAAKDRFVEQVRLLCIANGADATVFLTEAWMRRAKDEKKGVDLSIPPSQAPDREEMVILMGETREGHVQKMLPILRSADGKFVGFGESPEIKADKVQGRFAQFIPPFVTNEEVRKEAKAALAILGIVQEEEQKRERSHGRLMF